MYGKLCQIATLEDDRISKYHVDFKNQNKVSHIHEFDVVTETIIK